MNQSKEVATNLKEDNRKGKTDYLNLMEAKKQSFKRHIEKKYEEFNKRRTIFNTETTSITANKIDEIDIAAITIKEEVETAV